MAGVDYDRLGKGYAAIRRPDPRVAALIQRALGDAGSVVNVGAGTGSYEPTDRRVVAVEPSAVMLRQRPRMSAPAVQAVAEALPFRDRSFDASMGIFTVHHRADQTEGLAELQRVARRRIVIVTSDPEVEQFFWLNEFYFPALTRLDRDRVRGPEALLDRLGPGKVIRVPVPHDCEDGFCSAYWRRPEAYLDPKVRAGISYFAAMDLCRRSPRGSFANGLHQGKLNVPVPGCSEVSQSGLQSCLMGYQAILDEGVDDESVCGRSNGGDRKAPGAASGRRWS